MNAANGLVHLHSKGILHRDIKLGNFLVDEHYNAFVIDFGVSRVATFDPKDKMTLVGTPTYMAPEVLDAKPYDHKADTYSFAFVLWAMVRRTVLPSSSHFLLCQSHVSLVDR
jgi:fused-like protein